jgi:hypothetical protein
MVALDGKLVLDGLDNAGRRFRQVSFHRAFDDRPFRIAELDGPGVWLV